MHLLNPVAVTTPELGRRLGDAKAVAEILDISERTVYRLADRGAIPFGCKVGASRRWDLAELDDFIRDGCQPIRARPGRSKT